jgi:hypothetical protein
MGVEFHPTADLTEFSCGELFRMPGGLREFDPFKKCFSVYRLPGKEQSTFPPEVVQGGGPPVWWGAGQAPV